MMISAAGGNLYAFADKPGHFLKYDVTKRELIDLGVPAGNGSYWSGCYDSATRKCTDFGQHSSGPIQIYDTLNHPRGLLIASYMNASVDFFNPN
jgi:hypothetical protein